MSEVVFVTGNLHKADYFARLMGLPIGHQKVELDELQSLDLHEIVEHKVRQAYDVVKKPVVVEDFSVEFNALGGLPGPFIKFFLEQGGVDVCCKMLSEFNDRSAMTHSTFGYYNGRDLRMFDSLLKGSISTEPRGQNGFGSDCIFIPEGSDLTLAELPQAENDRIYHELKKPFGQVREFLQSLDKAAK